jgi:hypothetical protein
MDQRDRLEFSTGQDRMIATSQRGGRADPMSLMPSFLGELARAMQAAAERERKRIAGVIADDAAEHVETTQRRAAAESEELRRLAEEDLQRIDHWAVAETERIRREAQRRSAARRTDLEEYLTMHDSIIATEIDGVDSAVRTFRATLDRFFDELGAMSDPADIARAAGSLPTPPDLGAVRAVARAGAVAQFAAEAEPARGGPESEAPSGPAADAGTETGVEPVVGVETSVGVMDPAAVGRADGLSDALGETDRDLGDPPAAPAADPLHVPADDPAEGAVTGSVEHPSAAVRLLRTIAPWATPGGNDASDRGAHAS